MTSSAQKDKGRCAQRRILHFQALRIPPGISLTNAIDDFHEAPFLRRVAVTQLFTTAENVRQNRSFAACSCAYDHLSVMVIGNVSDDGQSQASTDRLPAQAIETAEDQFPLMLGNARSGILYGENAAFGAVEPKYARIDDAIKILSADIEF